MVNHKDLSGGRSTIITFWWALDVGDGGAASD